jgi:gamma-glutamyltranspeptidase/glutathione hydrolase
LCKEINSYKICGFPPPTSGGIGVIQIMGMLDRKKDLFKKNDLFISKHYFIEASKLAYKDRNVFIADPEFFSVPTKILISDNYLSRRSSLINSNRAILNFEHGQIDYFNNKKINKGVELEKNSTTHISIIDAQGNAVSLTSSIEFAFGSGITVGGFFLNNQLTDFSFYNKNNKGNLIANRVAPNKKPRSSMSPTFVFYNKDLRGVLGSPGGSNIICYVAKVTFEIIFLNSDPLSSINSPHYCSKGKFTEIENSKANSDLKKYLIKKGHKIKVKEMTSGLNIIWKKNSNWYGYADFRREGFAIGK